MDADEFIRKREARSVKSEEDNMINFGGRMKAEGQKIAAHCLVGKIFHTRGVSREGLRATMQQVWRSIKELKVESLGENVFIFKFASESQKKKKEDIAWRSMVLQQPANGAHRTIQCGYAAGFQPYIILGANSQCTYYVYG